MTTAEQTKLLKALRDLPAGSEGVDVVSEHTAPRRHGPYIVTTKHLTPDGLGVTKPNVRRAVATLEEARQTAREGAEKVLRRVPQHDFGQLTDSGGSVGPLPDGTVIEVEPTTYHALWLATPYRQRGGAYFDTDGSDNIAAYNAAQAEGLMS